MDATSCTACVRAEHIVFRSHYEQFMCFLASRFAHISKTNAVASAKIRNQQVGSYYSHVWSSFTPIYCTFIRFKSRASSMTTGNILINTIFVCVKILRDESLRLIAKWWFAHFLQNIMLCHKLLCNCWMLIYQRVEEKVFIRFDTITSRFPLRKGLNPSI